MAEIDRDEIDALAGEYVLGTLDVDERRAAETRIAREPAFAAAVAAWAERLQPLADALPPAEPHGGLFARILARIGAEGASAAAPGDTVVALARAVRRWRNATAIIGAAAAALLTIVVLDRIAPPAQTEFVAVLTSEGAKPAFVATVDVKRGTMQIRRIAGDAPPDKSFQLWAVEPGAAPRSLGLVEQASYRRGLDVPLRDLTLAISLEPKGGSPTGAPTGPVVFSGNLVPAE